MKKDMNLDATHYASGEKREANSILNMCFDDKELRFIGSFRFNNLPFNGRYLDNLRNYRDLCKLKGIKFDGKAQMLNDELYKAVDKFFNDSEGNFFADGNGNYTILQEWKVTQREKYLEVSKTLNNDLQDIWDRYIELIYCLKKGE